jgi:probable rRNA maturation factor
MEIAIVGNFHNRARLNLGALRTFSRRLHKTLALRRRTFDVSLVNDHDIRRLNSQFRGKRRATDVLSFPWNSRSGNDVGPGEHKSYLGEIVISVETARRNAQSEGHSLENELQWLILHGALHLLGYDHERDGGKMTALELDLRERLGVADGASVRSSRIKARRIKRT